ncbi:hypothetical protein [uncultured Christiangramia sp.]|uniref:hypothetical protein n=1 Tax=uncultured Christiangramia sp. TaxID=503836 RepID=UPI002630F4DE|nr:hypothetical protein [uncultured Christiangramia sp.]
MSSTEIKSMTYENFMNQAYRLDKRITRPNKREFQNLVRLEDKNENTNKNLKELKSRMHKACEIFFNQDISSTEQDQLSSLMSLIAQANSSQEIYECAKLGKGMTQRFK